MKSSVVSGVYDNTVDRESAYEILKSRAGQPVAPAGAGGQPTPSSPASWLPNLGTILGGGGSRRGDTLAEAAMKSAARAMGSSVGRQIVRGVLGSLLGGSKR
jgi:hypothetical protein